MFTVCPKCTMTLAVTAADLRIGQGYVRCGRCLNVFNALLTLSDEPADPSPSPTYTQADPASSSQITNALSAAADAAQEIEILPETPGHASPAHGPPTQLVTERSSDGAIENESSLADGTGTFETIVLEGDTISQTEEFVPEESVDSEIAALTQRLEMAANEPLVGPPHLESASLARDDQSLTNAEAPPQAVAPDLLEIDIATLAQTRNRVWPLVTGCAVLLALLALQAVHHWRDALAVSPWWRGPLNRIYAAIGQPLDPHWNLAAYDIRQQGAVADALDAHIIRVRLSVSNRAERAQPVPLVRLTLLDRYGKHIAARDLTPVEYWPRGQTARNFLARDERIDTEVAVRDPNSDSSSFELDVCLKSARGVLHCAGDSAAASADVSASRP